MYEKYIKDLTAFFKGKREKARDRLIYAMANDPYNLTKELLNAPESVWPYVREIIKSNRYGVFLAILATGLNHRGERFLQETGYGHMVEKIYQFQKEIKRADTYKKQGIPLDYDRIVSDEFLSGNVEKALRDIKSLNDVGKKLSAARNKWKDLKSLSGMADETIPDITPAIKNLDVEKAEKIIQNIDEERLREKAQIMEKYRETASILKEIGGVTGAKELGERLKSAKTVEDLERVKEEILALKETVDGILSIWDDEEIRELMREDLEKTRRIAELKRKTLPLAETLGEEHVEKLRESSENIKEIIKTYIANVAPTPSKSSKEILNQALKTVKKIKGTGSRDRKQRVSANIAIQLAKTNPEKSLEIAKNLEGNDKDVVFAKIAVEQARIDLKKALNIAKNIGSNYKKFSAFSDIAAELAKTDPEKALKVSGYIGFDTYKAQTFAKIAVELAKTAPKKANKLFDQAIRAAKKMDEPEDKARWLAEIAAEMLKTNPKKANNVITQAIRAAKK